MDQSPALRIAIGPPLIARVSRIHFRSAPTKPVSLPPTVQSLLTSTMHPKALPHAFICSTRVRPGTLLALSLVLSAILLTSSTRAQDAAPAQTAPPTDKDTATTE